MEMITQDEVNIQETLTTVFRNVPAIIINDKEAYVIVKDVCKPFEEYIQTGKVEKNVIGLFTETQEKELIEVWSSSGYKCMFRYQTLEYMHKRTSVRYPVVYDQHNDFNVSLFPWCMLPGRPYPVFLYAFANWHYSKSEKKSMRLSACAAGKVFGVDSFNKSTLSRMRKNKRITGIQADNPQKAGGQDDLRYIDAAARAVEILEHSTSIQNKKEPSSDGRHSIQSSSTEFIISELDFVPIELSKVIKDNLPVRHNNIDARKRPLRLRHAKKSKRAQRSVNYVNSAQIEHIRNAFIASCKAAVMSVAAKYHRFLI